MCQKGKIQGALKVQGRWQIPDNVKKPEDGRISSGKYRKRIRKNGNHFQLEFLTMYVRSQNIIMLIKL